MSRPGPLEARISSADLLDWFNAKLLLYGQDMWDIKGKKWSCVKAKLDFYTTQWSKCKSPTVVPNTPTTPCKKIILTAPINIYN